MIPINRTYAPLQAFVEELVRCGMRHAVTSPGSRNAPLTLTLAAQAGLESVSVIDERCAGFVALGMAKASGLPVAVTCTSGTAAANLHPAVVEAREARAPLIVLTADRPPELRDVGAGQAIDQIRLYGTSAKWFVEVGNMEPGRGSAIHHRALACRAFWTAKGGRPGPVHLNFPLREPLAPIAEALEAADWQGRPDGSPWATVRAADAALREDDVDAVAARMRAARRGIIVCGSIGAGDNAPDARPAHSEPETTPTAAEQDPGRTDSSFAETAARLARGLGWPLLAEPTSGLRCGPHDRSHVVAHYDVLLRSERFAADHVPDLVLRIGDTPTSKPLRGWLADAPQIVIDPDAAWHEPTRAAELLLQAPPSAALDALSASLEADAPTVDDAWLRGWREADALVPHALAAVSDPCEPKALAAIEPALADDHVVWVSSSMPIRHVEAFFPQSDARVRFLANRGANGIDGVISSAAGAALATGAPTIVLIGEIALLHDIGGLLAAKRAGAQLTIVCVNNGGGAIFDLLPVAGSALPEHYERHIATPADLSLADVAALAGMRHVQVVTPDDIRAQLTENTLLELRSRRSRQTGPGPFWASMVATITASGR
jgi:2-succinyl-5-enolpyruvyl-6-hydroxy-3-cyclohexene-1-carboxylate synthase